MEWNVPGKYGPHGELFFFQIQKEPALVPDSETFRPFINADIRTLLFSADVLEECAWELAKVAMSCHMALDFLCQEMHEAW